MNPWAQIWADSYPSEVVALEASRQGPLVFSFAERHRVDPQTPVSPICSSSSLYIHALYSAQTGDEITGMHISFILRQRPLSLKPPLRLLQRPRLNTVRLSA